jgi:hypothetical protein
LHFILLPGAGAIATSIESCGARAVKQGRAMGATRATRESFPAGASKMAGHAWAYRIPALRLADDATHPWPGSPPLPADDDCQPLVGAAGVVDRVERSASPESARLRLAAASGISA